jgi:hypothetical protein
MGVYRSVVLLCTSVVEKYFIHIDVYLIKFKYCLFTHKCDLLEKNGRCCAYSSNRGVYRSVVFPCTSGKVLYK